MIHLQVNLYLIKEKEHSKSALSGKTQPVSKTLIYLPAEICVCNRRTGNEIRLKAFVNSFLK